MPSLTGLPLPILQVILRHLERGIPERHHFLRHTTSFLPDRHPGVHPSLDGVKDAHAVLPACLLAPALASPVLAAACARNLGSRVSYLTCCNTGGRLTSWVAAFAPWVRAVCADFVAEEWDEDLGIRLRAMRVEKVCKHTVELLRAISVRNVKLRVLDLVDVPFDKCKGVEDELMAALCGTLEAASRTLTELALPVYLTSDMCALALETVTLPHLSVLSIELRNVPLIWKLAFSRDDITRHPFLRMMQAADGHADRSRKLTTLGELRLFDIHHVPCTKISESGCSKGFFRAVRTLRVDVSDAIREITFKDLKYLSLFENLEYLYLTLMPGSWLNRFSELLKQLKEVHFCNERWIRGVEVGADISKRLEFFPNTDVINGIRVSRKKIATLMTFADWGASDVTDTADGCPNLRYLSLHVTNANIYKLRGLIKKFTQLTGLEMITNECHDEELGNAGWEMLGKAIPRRHANLREIAIQPYISGKANLAPLDGVVRCFRDVVKRLGPCAERLMFRALVDYRNRARTMNALCRVLDACADHSYRLTHIDINIIPCGRPHVVRFSLPALYDTSMDLQSCQLKLKTSRDILLSSQPNLRKLDLGWHHRLLGIPIGYDSVLKDTKYSNEAEGLEGTVEDSV